MRGVFDASRIHARAAHTQYSASAARARAFTGLILHVAGQALPLRSRNAWLTRLADGRFSAASCTQARIPSDNCL
jgi:hypothetical protein